jgi:hypothetical protein
MKFPSTISFSIFLFALSAHADDKRIYQTESIGNNQYNAPSYTIQKWPDNRN